MAQPYFSSRGLSDQTPQYSQPPNSYPAFSLLLGSGHVPNNLLYWNHSNNHNHNQISQPETSPIARSPFSLQQQQHLQPSQQQQQQQPSTEQRKHKRTRSGCLTCRARRIKCDEGRPVCERCRKGNRPCEYARPSIKSTNRTTKSRRQSSQESVSSDEDNDEPGSGGGGGTLDVIPDEDETTTENPSDRLRRKIGPEDPSSKRSNNNNNNKRSPSKHRPRNTSEASSGNNNYKSKSLSPASDWMSSSQSPSSSANSQYSRSHLMQRPARDLREMFKHKRLNDDVWYFLQYHQEKLNHNHYLMNFETDMFFRGTLMDLAVDYEPLMYALVGFAAYHHTLENPQGKLYDFLGYYNTSLKLLRKSLASGVKHNEGTLATILQLSTFEESIGDFVNLVDHHQAADLLIHELLTPTSITQNHMHRYLFIWHARFDLVACLIASNEAILGPDWYTAIEQHDTAQAAQDPNDFIKQLKALASRTRLFAMEYASLFAQLSRGLIHPEEFEGRFKSLNQVIKDLNRVLEQYDECDEITTPRPAVPLEGPDDVLDTPMRCRFYTDSKYMLNFIWADLLSTELMFKYQTHLLMGRPEGAELQDIALRICHHAESIARWPEVEVGSMVGFHNWMVLTTLFLPKDSRHMMWTRRMFARVEVNGYIYSPRVRRALSEIWNDSSVEEWWDPSDEGGCPSLIKEIRSLTEERTTSPRDQVREDVRDLKSLFGNMRMDDSTPESGH